MVLFTQGEGPHILNGWEAEKGTTTTSLQDRFARLPRRWCLTVAAQEDEAGLGLGAHGSGLRRESLGHCVTAIPLTLIPQTRQCDRKDEWLKGWHTNRSSWLVLIEHGIEVVPKRMRRLGSCAQAGRILARGRGNSILTIVADHMLRCDRFGSTK